MTLTNDPRSVQGSIALGPSALPVQIAGNRSVYCAASAVDERLFSLRLWRPGMLHHIESDCVLPPDRSCSGDDSTFAQSHPLEWSVIASLRSDASLRHSTAGIPSAFMSHLLVEFKKPKMPLIANTRGQGGVQLLCHPKATLHIGFSRGYRTPHPQVSHLLRSEQNPQTQI